MCFPSAAQHSIPSPLCVVVVVSDFLLFFSNRLLRSLRFGRVSRRARETRKSELRPLNNFLYHFAVEQSKSHQVRLIILRLLVVLTLLTAAALKVLQPHLRRRCVFYSFRDSRLRLDERAVLRWFSDQFNINRQRDRT